MLLTIAACDKAAATPEHKAITKAKIVPEGVIDEAKKNNVQDMEQKK